MSNHSSSSAEQYGPTKAGHLKKKGLWGHWKDAWFEISASTLFQYSNQKDLLQANHQYPLRGVMVHPADSLTGLKFTFLMIMPDKKRQLFFQASSSEDCSEWMHMIEKCSKLEEGKNTSLKSKFLLEAFNDAVVLTDERANILDMNTLAQDMFGWRVEEVIGKPVAIFMPESMAQAHSRYVDKYNATGEKRLIGKPRKMKAVHRSGTTFPILLSLGEINTGETKRYIATMKNLSEEEVSVEKLTSAMDHKIDEMCGTLKEKLAEATREFMKVDESTKMRLEEAKTQNKELRSQVRELSSQLQLERTTHAIVSNALYALLRSGLANKQDTASPLAIAKKLVTEQLEETGNPNNLFREDSESMRKLLAFMAFEGASYLVFTLERPLQKMLQSLAEKKDLSSSHMIKYTTLIVEAILTSEKMIPETMRELFMFIREQMLAKGWKDYKVIIGGMLVLRFINPVIVTPAKFGLVSDTLDDMASKSLVNISKILMSISTGSNLPEELRDLQPFVNEKAKVFDEFVDAITKPASSK